MKNNNEVSKDIEDKMRLFVNIIIDRVLEDKKKNVHRPIDLVKTIDI